MTSPAIRMGALLGVLALTAAACGTSKSSNRATPTTSTASGGATTTMAMMPLPPGAENMKVTITTPADGTKLTDNAVKLAVATSGYQDTCDLAGKPEVNAQSGHYHVLIDKSLVNMYCTPEAVVSMQNVKPGTHTLTVVPALNDHAEVEANARSITLDYEPAKPLPVITDETKAAKPSIKIMSPKAGDTVKGAFDVVVEWANFEPNCNLFGKPGVAGYGHWHLNMDATSGPMMGMGTMFGMSCDKVFHATTAGLNSGEKHTLIALLVDNGHAPLMPEVDDKVEVTIG
jgi:hypothetical protein